MKLMTVFQVGILAALLIVPAMGAADDSIGPGSMATMQFMLGTWDCSGRMVGTGSPFAYTETRTLVGDRIVIFSPLVPFGSSSIRDQQRTYRVELWWDAAKKLWNTTVAANGFYKSTTSLGWIGDTMVSTGTLSEIEYGPISEPAYPGMPPQGPTSQVDYPTYPYRATITKLSDTKTEDYDEIGRPDGRGWVVEDSEVCKKR